MTRKRRKPYKSPTVTSERILETAALACGKCLGRNPVFNKIQCLFYNRIS